jgi:hypothetical protein
MPEWVDSPEIFEKAPSEVHQLQQHCSLAARGLKLFSSFQCLRQAYFGEFADRFSVWMALVSVAFEATSPDIENRGPGFTKFFLELGFRKCGKSTLGERLPVRCASNPGGDFRGVGTVVCDHTQESVRLENPVRFQKELHRDKAAVCMASLRPWVGEEDVDGGDGCTGQLPQDAPGLSMDNRRVAETKAMQLPVRFCGPLAKFFNAKKVFAGVDAGHFHEKCAAVAADIKCEGRGGWAQPICGRLDERTGCRRWNAVSGRRCFAKGRGGRL